MPLSGRKPMCFLHFILAKAAESAHDFGKDGELLASQASPVSHNDGLPGVSIAW